MSLQVIKKDGSREDFTPDKIEKVVASAGLTPDQSKVLSQKIVQWFQGQGKTQITTLEIRTKVIEELSKVDKFATDAYTWYEKAKNGD